MSYRYNVYGVNEVNNAARNYENIADNAPVYADSTATAQARTNLNSAESAYKSTVNGGYKSKYESTVNELVNKYNSENNFGWSADSSEEYQGMKDSYRREAEKQQENVAGSYAANTGGYSNSYAQAAGQRVYNQKTDELAEKIPALRETALNNWSANQERTMNQIGMMQGLDDNQYKRYRDSVADKFSFMQYYQQKYATEKGLDMSAFSNELAMWQSRMNAAASNLSSVRTLAESQYEHNTLSAGTKAQLDSSRRQTDAYYNYLNNRVK